MSDANNKKIKPSQIEKESLEAHAELCAERYNQLNTKLDTMDRRIDGVEGVLLELRDKIFQQKDARQRQIIGWGVGLIGFMGSAILGLIFMVLQGGN